jgi:ABC-type bacteriocin/lantibiotic exporter with double-glycine peptidase domain
LLGIGAFLVVSNQLTLGQLFAAEIVVTTALGSLAKFQKHLEAYYDLVAALDKIDGLMSLPLERFNGESLPEKKEPASIEIRNLYFSYVDGPPVFEDLDFIAEPGSRIALLGSNASGKTTLVDLIYGIKSPQRGTLLIDGVDYRDLSPELLRSQVALVRGVEFLPDTIIKNIRVGRNYISLEKIRESLSRVGLLDELLRFPLGIHTKLGEEGAPLSVAQAHALVLARAIVGEPRLLLIDETLDDLDEKSRDAALQVLLDPKAPWTLLLSTHSESLARRFREILSIDAARERRSA